MQISTISVVIEFMSLGYLKAVAGPTLYGNRNGTNLDINLEARSNYRPHSATPSDGPEQPEVGVSKRNASVGRLSSPRKPPSGELRTRVWMFILSHPTSCQSNRLSRKMIDGWMIRSCHLFPGAILPSALWPCEGFCKPSDVELPHVVRIVSRCLHE